MAVSGTEQVVLVIGSLNMDLVVKAARLPLKGETIFGTALARFAGGKGANQAIAAARMGAKVAMAGCVGADDFGRELYAGLTANQVDASYIRLVEDCATGTALITVAENGDNTILVVPGANNSINEGDIDAALAGWPSPGVLVLQHEIPAEMVSYAIKAAKAKGWFIILNPAPARDILPDVMQQIDLLVPNETEAEFLCQRPIKSLADAAVAARVLQEHGAKAVVITMGGQGAVCRDGQAVWHVPPLSVTAVDSTAAGDAFIGALSCGIAQGEALTEALKLAAIAAGLSVTRPGAQPSLPLRQEVAGYAPNITIQEMRA